MVGDRLDLGPQLLDVDRLLLGEVLPALARELADLVEPVRVDLVRQVVVEEVLARDAEALGQPEQLAFEHHQLAVQVVERELELLDAVGVDVHRAHQLDDLLAVLLVALLELGAGLLAAAQGRQAPVLHLRHLDIDLGDARQRAQHLGLELLLERRQRQRVLVVILAALGPARHRRPASPLTGGGGAGGRTSLGIAGRGIGRRHRGRRRHDALALAGRAALGRLEVDHVAQQDAALVDRVAPRQQRRDGHRALADAADHLVLAGLDALGDLDLALAAQQLDAAHLAQVHAHGIVGAAELLVLAGRFGGDHGGLGRLSRSGGGGLFLLLGLDHVDAGFRQHRHRVLDLLGGHFVGRQGGVQLVVGDVAALLALLDELLELGAEGVEQRGVGPLFAGVGGFRLGNGRGLGRHSWSLGAQTM